LFCVPVEERGEVGVEVEADLGVFFAFGGVVVWSALDAVLDMGLALIPSGSNSGSREWVVALSLSLDVAGADAMREVS
jgi:hypothetical protein